MCNGILRIGLFVFCRVRCVESRVLGCRVQGVKRKIEREREREERERERERGRERERE
jgi:hypothetical protein